MTGHCHLWPCFRWLMWRQRLVTNAELQVEWIAQVRLKKTRRDLGFWGLFKGLLGTEAYGHTDLQTQDPSYNVFIQPDADTWYYGCYGNDIQAAEDTVIYQQVLNVSHIEVLRINQECRNWPFFFFECCLTCKQRHVERLSSCWGFQKEMSCLLFVTGKMPPHKPYILLCNLRVNPYGAQRMKISFQGDSQKHFNYIKKVRTSCTTTADVNKNVWYTSCQSCPPISFQEGLTKQIQSDFPQFLPDDVGKTGMNTEDHRRLDKEWVDHLIKLPWGRDTTLD